MLRELVFSQAKNCNENAVSDALNGGFTAGQLAVVSTCYRPWAGLVEPGETIREASIPLNAVSTKTPNSRTTNTGANVFSLIPQEKGFFDFFEKAAAVAAEAASAYSDVLNDYENRQAHVARIKQLENKGDEIVHGAVEKLNTTFLTPFDREDIQGLMKLMDDVVDDIDSAAKRLMLYRIPEPSKWLFTQVDILVRCTSLIGEAVKRLRNVRSPNGLHDKLVEIHKLENQGDETNHGAVADLYNNCTDAIMVLKWREIYERTERAIDRCEDIADTIESIVLKNT